MSESTNFKAEFLATWRNAKNYTEKVAAALPQSYFTKRPNQDMRTFAEILQHIGEAIQYDASFCLTIKVLRYSGATYDKEAIINFVKSAYESIEIAVEKMDEEDFRVQKSIWTGDFSIGKILLYTNDHATHHRGQLTMYLRLFGVKPPSYIGW